MTGMLYVKVDSTWVPVLGGGIPSNVKFVIDPAEAGARGDQPADARFGNIAAADKRLGLMVGANGQGFMIQPNNLPFLVYQINAAGTGYDTLASFGSTTSFVNDLCLGIWPPNTGYRGLWRSGYTGIDNYLLIQAPTETLLNAPPSGVVRLRVANNSIGEFDNSAITFHRNLALPGASVINAYTIVAGSQLQAARPESSTEWNGALILSYNTASTISNISFHVPGLARQWTVEAATGDAINAKAGSTGIWTSVNGTVFTNQSSLTIKRDVRLLRPERERIVVRHEPMVDTVPEPDVMALRPIVFRFKDVMQRIVPAPGYDSYSADDPDSFVYIDEPADTVFGRQSRRERLGLIAEDVQHIIPSAVSHDIDGNAMGIDYAQITVALLDHVQRLTEEVATLRYRITELEGAQP